MWAVLVAFAFLTSTVHLLPNDPRQFGKDGVIVSDRTDGQYSIAVLAQHNIRVAWQRGYDDDPNLAMQVFDSFGRKAGGREGIEIPRDGIQTQPALLSRSMVFSESADGENWRVMLATSGSLATHFTVLSEGAGSVAELHTTESEAGVIAVSWIRSNDVERRLDLCIVDRDVVHIITICRGTHAFQDLHMVVSGPLLTLAWTDFRDALHPSVYGQMVDLDSRTCLWPANGWNLVPATSWAWNPEIASLSEPGYVSLAYQERVNALTTLRYQVVDYQMNFRFFPSIVLSGPSEKIGNHDMAQFQDESFIAWSEGLSLREAFVRFDGEIESVGQPINARIDDLRACASDQYAWVVWNDDRLGRLQERVFCQRFNVLHKPQWPESGLRISSASGPQRAPCATVVSDDPSALAVAWEDYRYHPMIPCAALQFLK